MHLQYTAVGIQNISRMAVTRDDYMKDIADLATSIRYAVWNCSLDLPVKLVAVSEGGIGGWCLGGGADHLRIAREVAPEIPGPERGALISVAADTPGVGVGVGGAIVILGASFIVRSLVVKRLPPPATPPPVENGPPPLA